MNKNCYIHIPFCDLKCKYCRFASIGIKKNDKVNFYIKNLILEINKSPYKKEILNTIYFGGGTPSILSGKNLRDIFNIIKRKFKFGNNIEITLESTPNNITKENLKLWKDLGLNRLSIGIQTLNKKSLYEINRGNKGDIEECLYNLQKYNNIENISFDFILGLPYVASGEILQNIKYIIKNFSFVKHISVYMLEEYYNSEKIIDSKYDNITYPQKWKKLGIRDEQYLKEYILIKKMLIKNGFINYEISNFAKFGYECIHNKGYWNHKDVIAFGLGASGFINGKRYSNSSNFKDYYLGKNIFIEKLDDFDLFFEKIMFGLRTNGLHKEIYEKLNKEKIYYFIENGYLFFENDILKINDKGVLVLDHIIKNLFY